MSASTGVATRTLSRAQAAIEHLRAKVKALEQAKRESIAIVGIGCRLPCGVNSPDAFWDLLAGGVDAIGTVPPARWDAEAFYDPDPTVAGRMPMRHGSFIEGVDQFDPYFFGISPREAARMDPQQRIFLEVAWQALEDAGQTRAGIQGSATGVFVGANCCDYLQMQLAEPDSLDTYTVAGATNCIIPNRLSYAFDLSAPSLAVDTACSSSLVAVHLACQSLRSQECSAAVVGGMNLILSPIVTMAHSRGFPLAPDGRCKTFDARADGYVRGEGVVVVVLKRLSDALAGGDPIWAVIRGSAVNQDGLTNGLTAPNGRSQRTVVEQALRNAGIAPAQVSMLEAHGTGTEIGDPIEVEALSAVYGAGAGEAGACALGSVKTNLGHLEAGAGLVGLVKTALSIRNAAIPPSLHFETLNPHIELDDSRLFVPTSLQAWDGPDDHRHGAVSSFGAGGTNAHVVLGPGPPVAAGAPAPARPGPSVIPISGHTEEACRALARAYGEHLRSPRGQASALTDIAYSATVRRTQHEHRCAVVAASHSDAAERLDAWADGQAPAGVVAGRSSAGVAPGVVFVFPGQGTQRHDMGRELMDHCAVFRSALVDCDDALGEWLGRSIVDEIHGMGHDDELDRIELIQPALFAIAVALAARWRSLGIVPDAIIGHSMGEVAAAHVAGALSLEDASRIICRRSALLAGVAGQGAMLVVALPMADADGLLADYRDEVSVAVNNSPTSTVLSGTPAALAELADRLRAHNVFCRPVKDAVASHSPAMDVLREELLAALAGISPRASSVPLLSTVTGELCDGSEYDEHYWFANLREPVRFWDGVTALVEQGSGVFVELSPHPILLSSVEQGFEATGRPGLALASMRRDEPEPETMLAGLAALHVDGLPAALDSLLAQAARVVALPTYAWQHESFWFRASEKPANGVARAATDRLAQAAQAPVAPAGSDLLRRLDAAFEAERHAIVYEFVLAAVAAVLAFDPARIDPDDGFFQMGMDSLLAAQVRVRLEAGLERKLPSPVMFEHPTVGALTRYALQIVVDAGAPGVPDEPATRTPTPTTPSSHEARPADDVVIDELAEDELLELLAAETRTSARSEHGLRR